MAEGPSDPVAALAELVAFPTVSHEPVSAMAAWLAERAEDAGMRVERFETSPGKVNVLCTAGPEEGDGLALSGHMDVVPVEGQAWSRDPFRLHEEGGRLYARGSADMKGFLAAVITALPGMPLRRLRGRLVLAWTHDEEVGCHGSAALVERLAALGRDLPSLTWIGEPTELRILRAHPGHTTMRIRCQGRPAHSARPELGLSAIAIASDVLRALADLQEALRREPVALEPELAVALPHPYPLLNVGLIEGGTAVNIVPERCELRVGVRQLPGQTGAALVERLRAALEPVTQRWAAQGGVVEVLPMHEAPALLTEAGTTLEALLRPHARQVQPGAAPFATDGGNLSRLGTRCLVFGPGSIDVAHRPDEYLPLDQLLAVHRFLPGLIAARCGDL